jgi:sulfatase modifying factor 1
MAVCCGPSTVAADVAEDVLRPVDEALLALGSARSPKDVHRGMRRLDGGIFAMGSDDADAVAADGEGPVREVAVAPFRIDETTVTTRAFARFVRETGYVTDAERLGWSFVFDGFLPPQARGHVLDGSVPGAPWWRPVAQATWRQPYGPGTASTRLDQHPVVHVSFNDAAAFAAWAGKQLPTEAQWEYAARGGLARRRFAWGDDLTPGGRHRANIWQGEFPRRNTGDDGYLATAPVRSFAPNGFGLYEVAGNVWEWCADWWSTTWHVADSPATRVDPAGPPSGTHKLNRGGSHLCHASYCNRYRVAARTSNTPDSSTSNMGFRCVFVD